MSVDIIEPTEDAYLKAKARLEAKARLHTCLAGNVCPRCGSDLSSEHAKVGGKLYTCTVCSFNYHKS